MNVYGHFSSFWSAIILGSIVGMITHIPFSFLFRLVLPIKALPRPPILQRITRAIFHSRSWRSLDSVDLVVEPDTYDTNHVIFCCFWILAQNSTRLHGHFSSSLLDMAFLRPSILPCISQIILSSRPVSLSEDVPLAADTTTYKNESYYTLPILHLVGEQII